MAELPTRIQLIRQGATALAFSEPAFAPQGLELMDTIDQALALVEEGEAIAVDLVGTAEQLLVDAAAADQPTCR